MIIKLYGEFTKQHLFVDRLKAGKNEYFNDLYNKYYYIVDKFCEKYDGELKKKAIEIAEDILKCAILEFCEKQEVGSVYRISSFIHNKFQSFDNKVIKPLSLNDIEQEAYNNNQQAREQLLNRYQKTINKYIDIFINFILDIHKQQMQDLDDYSYLDEDFEFSSSIVNYEEINQDYYLYAWTILNEYYDAQKNNSEFYYFLNNNLNKYTKAKINRFKYTFNNCPCSLEDNVSLCSLTNEFDKIEIKDLLENLDTMFNNKEKSICKGVALGLTYTQIGKQLGMTRQNVSLIVSKLKNKVKK